MDVQWLKEQLKKIEAISDQQWLDGLSDRKIKELEFHDKDRDPSRIESLDQDTYERFYGNRKYYQGTRLSKEYVDDWIVKNCKDRVFLDYACGNGSNAIKAAQAGAKLAIGLDISRVSVENAKAEAKRLGLEDNTYFVQADAENTKLPNDAIDSVICSGMLHHLDLSYAFPELRRILRPGGKILAVEALDYNPLIKLYRYLTPQMRTDWEKAHILSLKDIRFAERFFEVGEVKYWHITSILATYMIFAFKFLNWLDRCLTRVPFVRLMSWIFTFELIKPLEEK
ncbi:type 11 methyltransferase [Oleiphilus messinensis]|uniref:Type 11 methyltransferase n=1 Tax=Oleiphilus messinensis TaxID=141451 RepID=A0A1Y0IHD2_9GAMM|nr:class I SAM-dependent methyltransferase [Oleiphilus messinensis]ARU59549.1 type 11 methyltransferase [Oleiphilus messinensis]